MFNFYVNLLNKIKELGNEKEYKNVFFSFKYRC